MTTNDALPLLHKLIFHSEHWLTTTITSSWTAGASTSAENEHHLWYFRNDATRSFLAPICINVEQSSNFIVQSCRPSSHKPGLPINSQEKDRAFYFSCFGIFYIGCNLLFPVSEQSIATRFSLTFQHQLYKFTSLVMSILILLCPRPRVGH